MAFDFRLFFSAPILYLDPGSGSLLVQLLLAAALGIGVAVRIYWNKLKSLFGGHKSGSNDPSDHQDEM